MSQGDAIDWAQVEHDLFEYTRDEIYLFAREHADETFYGFAFDINADDGSIYLAFHSVQGLADLAKRYKTKTEYEEYTKKSLEEIQEYFRWSLGDWEHTDFASDAFTEKWQPWEELIHDTILDLDDESEARPLQNALMQSACRVALRLERDNIFQKVKVTDDFKVWAADSAELEEEAWARLEKVRAEGF